MMLMRIKSAFVSDKITISCAIILLHHSLYQTVKVQMFQPSQLNVGFFVFFLSFFLFNLFIYLFLYFFTENFSQSVSRLSFIAL